ncbi:hypothetical protein KO489_08210 [Reinekea forsetii]|nr:hypothetical protein [Reinekea forsetii]
MTTFQITLLKASGTLAAIILALYGGIALYLLSRSYLMIDESFISTFSRMIFSFLGAAWVYSFTSLSCKFFKVQQTS